MAPRRRRLRRTPIVAVSGWSGSGKTRLLAGLIPALARRGVVTAVLKHTRHPHAFDRRGKDTDVLRRAGAVAAAIDGPEGMAFFGPPAGGLAALAAFLPPVDLVLAEGWKDAPVPRIEVHRRRVARGFLCAHDRRVFAAVTDEPPPRPVAAFGHGEIEALAAFVCERLGLGTAAGKHERSRRRRAAARSSSRKTGASPSRAGSRSRRGRRSTGR